MISLFIVLALTFGLATPALAARDVASDWAMDAVAWLWGTGKLTQADFAGYDRTVTRADFARLGVVLYELITGRPKPVPAGKDTFTDTDNADVLRAYRIGLVAGMGDGTFAPNAPVSREQIALMLMRVLDACDMTYSKADVSAIHFSDEAQLSPWAAEAVKRAYFLQIMNGTGGTAMSPKMTVTMEQTYQLLYNIYIHRDAIRAGEVRAIVQGAMGTLSLKYTGGGRYETGYCEDTYHCRPVACDLLGNPIDIASLPMNERLMAAFTHSKAVIADLDGNGANEVVVVGDLFDRLEESLPIQVHQYQELFIFNGDRTRFNGAWAVEPTVKEPPLTPFALEDHLFMERCMPDPVCADLDGDGRLEILYPGYAGKLNCYSLDHTQHGSWPINVYDGSTVEYPSSPVVTDLNGDGVPEVVFTTYTQKQGTKNGSLYIADNKGNVLQKLELPAVVGAGGVEPNGGIAPPVIADVDGDGRAEIVLQTYRSGVTVYDLD